MAPPITSTPLVPPHKITRLGLTARYDARYPIRTIDLKNRVQVRSGNNNARPAKVAKYAAMMDASEFPAIWVTRDGYLVDGNGRVAASLSRGLDFFPAWVIDVDFATADQHLRDELIAAGAGINAENGEPLDKAETRNSAAAMIRIGWENNRIVRELGVRTRSLSSIRNEIDAEARLDDVGLTERLAGGNGVPRVPTQVVRALGCKDALGLGHEPYKMLSELSFDANYTPVEVKAAAQKLSRLGSDELQMAHLKNERTQNSQRITDFANNDAEERPDAIKLRPHLNFIVKYHANPDSVIERRPAEAAQQVRLLDAAMATLKRVREGANKYAAAS